MYCLFYYDMNDSEPEVLALSMDPNRLIEYANEHNNEAGYQTILKWIEDRDEDVTYGNIGDTNSYFHCSTAYEIFNVKVI